MPGLPVIHISNRLVDRPTEELAALVESAMPDIEAALVSPPRVEAPAR